MDERHDPEIRLMQLHHTAQIVSDQHPDGTG